MQVDDIVLIEDSNAIRGQWTMGVVTETFPGKDGKVRSVNVKYKRTGDGVKSFTIVKRPVQKLVVLLSKDA